MASGSISATICLRRMLSDRPSTQRRTGRLLPLQTDGEQVVHAGQVGQEEVSTLEFRFSDPEGVLAESPIAAFKIECKALTTVEDGGGSVYETSYFRADLKLKKTGGIKVDLNSDKDE